MITITNNILTAKFSEIGAELKGLSDGKNDYIWPGDDIFWRGSCPVLFPICSGLINDTYRLGNKEYHIPKHGFARNMEFVAESVEQDAVTFLLVDTPETFEQFPYRFEFRITYKLSGKRLVIRYDIRNRDGEEMYFSVGGHEGYFCPEGIEQYDLLLPEEQTLVSTVLTGPNTLGYEQLTVTEDSDVLPLDYKYFAVDALVFLNFKGDHVVLKNRDNGRAVKVSFDGFPYLLLWTKPNAPFICIEPWCGIADRDDSNGQFETKQGICHINRGEVFVREHSIEVLD